MAKTDLTSLLIEKLKADHPELVFTGEDAEARVLRNPGSWKRVGSWAVGSPEFLKASQQRLAAGERVAVVNDGGRQVMVFASPRNVRDTPTPGVAPRRQEVLGAAKASPPDPAAGASAEVARRPTTSPPPETPRTPPEARRISSHGEPPKQPAAPAASLDKLPPRHVEPAPTAPNPFGAISPKLAGVLAAAEESVQKAEAAAKARKAGQATDPPPEGEAPAAPDAKALPPSKLPPRDLAPPPNTRRQIFGFLLLVSLFVYKVVTHEPEKMGKRQVDGMTVPVFPNPYKAEPLADLPSKKPPTVIRGGLLESSGKLQKKQLGRLVEAAIPQMKHCYHKALLEDAAGAGEGDARFAISWGEDGKVLSVTAESAPGNGKIGECGVAALSLLELPPEVASEAATGRTVVRFRAAP